MDVHLCRIVSAEGMYWVMKFGISDQMSRKCEELHLQFNKWGLQSPRRVLRLIGEGTLLSLLDPLNGRSSWTRPSCYEIQAHHAGGW